MENFNLENLATKSDIKSIRDDLKNFATKDDLGFVENEVKELRNNLSDLEKKFDHKFDDVLNQGDAQIKIMIEMQQELAAHNKSYKDHEEEIKKHENVLDDHESRIKFLEAQPAI
ncbi:MAG: hypothetical protein ABIF17_05415 [Patescibacteria group bacterium]